MSKLKQEYRYDKNSGRFKYFLLRKKDCAVLAKSDTHYSGIPTKKVKQP